MLTWSVMCTSQRRVRHENPRKMSDSWGLWHLLPTPEGWRACCHGGAQNSIALSEMNSKLAKFAQIPFSEFAQIPVLCLE